jgi:hypothetical protein
MVPLEDIMSFIAYMFRLELSHSTINCYISGLSFHHKISNLTDNTQLFVVRKQSLKATPYCRAVLGATESCNNRSISVWKSLTKTLPECRMEFDLPLEPKENLMNDFSFLELVPIILAFHIWTPRFINKKILLRIDNQALVAIVNNRTSSPKMQTPHCQ